MSVQNGQYFERSLDPCEYDVRRVEGLVPPSLPDENAEDIENKRAQNIPSKGGGGGQVLNPHYHLRQR